MAASATFALKSGEWFRRVRFVIFAPDSHAQPCALSGRDSTHRTDRNCEATSNTMALEIVTIHFLAGAALGLRFKVMILVPALTLTMLFAVIVGVTRGDQFWSIAVATILLGTAIQVGYLAGILIRAKIAWVRGQRTAVTIQKLGR